MMDRATLRLELLRIAHHHQQSTEVTLTIAKRYEEAFADLTLAEPRPVAERALVDALEKIAKVDPATLYDADAIAAKQRSRQAKPAPQPPAK